MMKNMRIWLLFGNICLLLLLTVLPFLTACSTATTETNTIKIGFIGWLGNQVGISTQKSLKVMANMINEQGGLNIEGTNYKVEVIVYDSNNEQATATAGVNRLIFEDDVKFIISDPFGYSDSLIPITEANRVILCAFAPTTTMLLPSNQYCFQTACANSQSLVNTAWFVENYPDKKNMLFVAPDNQNGHALVEQALALVQSFGLNCDSIFYPATQTDLSSVGTKVKVMNPDVVQCTDAPPFKDIWEAGWRGTFFYASVQSTEYLMSMGLVEALDGYIGGASPTEFEPALTEMAQAFKDSYIAEYGSWENPDMPNVPAFCCIIEGIKQAGSLDTDKVAEAIASGLIFEHPSGMTQMVSRPDLGNERTIDSVSIGYIKKISDGKPELFTTISLENAAEYFQTYLVENSQ